MMKMLLLPIVLLCTIPTVRSQQQQCNGLHIFQAETWPADVCLDARTDGVDTSTKFVCPDGHILTYNGHGCTGTVTNTRTVTDYYLDERGEDISHLLDTGDIIAFCGGDDCAYAKVKSYDVESVPASSLAMEPSWNACTTAPTTEPTAVPTSSPTAGPTGEPTADPSAAPSMPSSVPTSSPTYAPSTPSMEPTAMPTDDPTTDPTDDPTADPTSDPTQDPTSPTTVPTPVPTSSPTAMPTDDPTADPTKDPTADPTAAPTNDPTADPTTADPTADPTTDPTADPTKDPTADPTTDPTTATPTTSPTTADPTAAPTQDPTADPTTADPTTEPTQDPTADPTKSLAPTTEPTAEPTMDPTAEPTMEPTSDPVAAFDACDVCHNVDCTTNAGSWPSNINWHEMAVVLHDCLQLTDSETNIDFYVDYVCGGGSLSAVEYMNDQCDGVQAVDPWDFEGHDLGCCPEAECITSSPTTASVTPSPTPAPVPVSQGQGTTLSPTAAPTDGAAVKDIVLSVGCALLTLIAVSL